MVSSRGCAALLLLWIAVQIVPGTGRSAPSALSPNDKPVGNCIPWVIPDAGAQVWVDGEMVIDSWLPHESKVDRAPISGGKRRLKVEYYEAGGFAELRFHIQRR